MKMYRCEVALKTFVAVEAESLAEAERIIDGVLENADSVCIMEDGGVDNGGDELNGSRSKISRGRIQVEH